MKRCDSQLQLPAAAAGVVAAAADTSLMQSDNEADRRLSERERIKRAKHNGGTYLISCITFYGLCFLSSSSYVSSSLSVIGLINVLHRS